MKVNKTLELFYKFLEENNALIAWENNYLARQVEKGTNRTRAEFFSKMLDTGRYRLIGGAFVWMDTPQGHDYWDDLDRKWVLFLHQSIE